MTPTPPPAADDALQLRELVALTRRELDHEASRAAVLGLHELELELRSASGSCHYVIDALEELAAQEPRSHA